MRHKIESSGAVSNWDMAISEHLIEVNTRGGWGLSSDEPSWADRWVPWVLVLMTLGVFVMGWIRGWLS